MKIAIFTLGTRGDVQPYVALGKTAIEAGHSVSIATGGSFKQFVESHGINFYQTPLDLMAVLQTDVGQMMYNDPLKHPLKVMKLTKEIINPKFKASFDVFLEAAKDANVIIYHPKALVSQDIAKYYDIPCISMPLVPLTVPIEDFPNLFISATKNFGKNVNKFTYKATSMTENNNIKDINQFRQEKLGYSKRKANSYNINIEDYQIPVINPIGKLLFEDAKDLNSKVAVTGFLSLEDEDGQLSSEILNFISNGEKPIVITFSSLPLKDTGKLVEMIESALNFTGKRAIIISSANNFITTNENILIVKNASHSKLFPRCSGIIHHGGAGSSAASLKSGVPQLVVPHSLDQPFWAQRIYINGYSQKPIKFKDLNQTNLVGAINYFETKTAIVQAEKAKQKFDLENGNSEVLNIITDIVQSYNKK